MFKVIDIDPNVLESLNEDVKKHYVSNGVSIFQKNVEAQINANLVGRIGEYYFQELFPKAVKIDCHDYDFISNCEKVDVKTKKSAGIVREYYTCDIPAYSTKIQKNDSYFFFIVNKELTKLTVIGRISKQDFIKESKFFTKGTLVERNGYNYRVDTYSIEVGKINEKNKI